MPDAVVEVEGSPGSLVRLSVSLVGGLAAAFQEAEADLRAWMPYAAAEQEDAAGFIERCIAAFDSGQTFAYAVLVDDDVGGYVNVTPSEAGTEATIGYWLRPSARGRGVATAAVVGVAGAAFAAMSALVRVVADVDEANLRSRRVLERAGFAVESSRARPARTSAQSDVELVYVRTR